MQSTGMSDDELVTLADQKYLELARAEKNPGWTPRLRDWALSVFCWDGLLPIIVIAIPNFMQFVLPNWKIGNECVAVFCPVIALGFRFVVGYIRMRDGQSYFWQMIVFIVAISTLFLAEEFILSDQIGRGPKIADPFTLLEMFSLYLLTMAIALFPFRSVSFTSTYGN
jgi:hypothetical protein